MAIRNQLLNSSEFGLRQQLGVDRIDPELGANGVGSCAAVVLKKPKIYSEPLR
jgi:hypothetical protein